LGQSFAVATIVPAQAGFERFFRSLAEVGTKALNRHWQRGGFPLSFLARTNEDSATWRQQFLQTFLGRDVPQLGIHIPALALLRFWTMIVHRHGGIWSAADPARSLGIGESTVRRYLDLFTSLVDGAAVATMA
jgi:uncharacterized protein